MKLKGISRIKLIIILIILLVASIGAIILWTLLTSCFDCHDPPPLPNDEALSLGCAIARAAIARGCDLEDFMPETGLKDRKSVV